MLRNNPPKESLDGAPSFQIDLTLLWWLYRERAADIYTRVCLQHVSRIGGHHVEDQVAGEIIHTGGSNAAGIDCVSSRQVVTRRGRHRGNAG